MNHGLNKENLFSQYLARKERFVVCSIWGWGRGFYWFLCYYPHMSRDLVVSCVWDIMISWFKFLVFHSLLDFSCCYSHTFQKILF